MTLPTAAAEPAWLTWAREIQATAQTGLTFSNDPYDLDRYRALLALAARIMAAHTEAEATRIEGLFQAETGYATPKMGVRAAVFDDRERILMVRETADDHRWTLPGGWADVNQTAAQSVVREVFEESGYRVRPVKLAAVWDKVTQGHPPGPFSITTLFFICALEGGSPTTSLETSGSDWFAEDAIPADLSARRVRPHQIARMFAHKRDPALPTEFDWPPRPL
ncbi:MAG: NUDIX hydrolase [Acetobacteraceae bacterium]